YDMPGVVLDTTSYVPRGTGWVPFRDERVNAVRLRITDRDAFQPVWMTLVLLSEIRRLHPDRFRVTNDGMTQMLGSHWAREACHRAAPPVGSWRRWAAALDAWRPVRERHRLYCSISSAATLETLRLSNP